MQEFRMPTREQNSNKGSFGKVLCCCGSDNYIGAAYLSAFSALKVGAGLVALATVSQVINSVSASLPEAVYLTRAEGVDKINNFSVVLIGCGLGSTNDSKIFLEQVLNKIHSDIPIIIDADGLNLLSEFSAEQLKNLKKLKKIIITPHPLEAARLLGKSLDSVLSNLEDSAKALCSKFNCVTVLKTHRTIICDTDFSIYTNNYGCSALAKAGTGDVLAGIISGLIAQGVCIFDASKLGVYLHSVTGEILAEELTEYSVMASDIPKNLHKAIKKCL